MRVCVCFGVGGFFVALLRASEWVFGLCSMFFALTGLLAGMCVSGYLVVCVWFGGCGCCCGCDRTLRLLLTVRLSYGCILVGCFLFIVAFLFLLWRGFLVGLLFCFVIVFDQAVVTL